MYSSKISFDVSATGPNLCIEVRFNGKTHHKISPGADPQHIEISFPDEDDKSNSLEIILSGKTSDHTKIDDHGNIIEDRVVHISNIAMDEIHLAQIIHEKAVYSHDFNGTAPWQDDKFYGIMGCNGIVRLEFTGPVYMWLLESM